MANPRYIWDSLKRRIRDSAVGRFIARRQLTALRDGAATQAAGEMRDLAGRAVRGDLTVDAFRAEFRALVRNVNGAQYLLGRGGIHAMSATDFRSLTGIIQSQHAYLDRFVGDIERGILSEAQAMARAEMYADAGILAFERGQASAWGIDRQLPGYPGDGTCFGLTRCRCRWVIVEKDAEIEATWTLGATDACPVCVNRSQSWAPVKIPKPYAVPDRQPVRLAAIRRVA